MKKQRLGLDIRMIPNTGIGTYLKGLLGGMTLQPLPGNWDLTLWGAEDFAADLPFQRNPLKAPIYSAGEQLGYLKILDRVDLWHAPHYNIPFFKKKTKLVVTVHDLIHWIYRKDFFTPLQAFYAGTMFKRTVKMADHIIAVSERTKDDLVQYFQADPAKVSVIYESVLGDYSPVKNDMLWQSLQKTYGICEKYFLYVGSLKPHKNVSALLKAWKEARLAGDIQAGLVIAGRKDKRYGAEFRDLENLSTGQGIFYLPALSHESLQELYRRALALVHPSFYEGFGLTPLEAMACGTPVVCSQAASLPEVVGDAALMLDPHQLTTIRRALIQIENDAALRQELIVKGFNQLKKFSWQETANQTREVYQKVLS